MCVCACVCIFVPMRVHCVYPRNVSTSIQNARMCGPSRSTQICFILCYTLPPPPPILSPSLSLSSFALPLSLLFNLLSLASAHMPSHRSPRTGQGYCVMGKHTLAANITDGRRSLTLQPLAALMSPFPPRSSPPSPSLL